MSDPRIIHVIPSGWGPYVDIYASYESLQSRGRCEVISDVWFASDTFENLRNDKNVVFVIWSELERRPCAREDRKCALVRVYSEALDPNEDNMLVSHRDHLARWKAMWDRFDAVFVHTPSLAVLVGNSETPAYVMPVGWDADAMGMPRWSAPKHITAVYQGSDIGRRKVIIPYLERELAPHNYVNASGVYGRALLGRLDTSSLSLYIAHSEVHSFSTWRLWQVASTSCVLLGETGDSWPFEAGKHYIGMPNFTPRNAEAWVGDVLRWSKQRDVLMDIASAAHRVAKKFSVDAVNEQFVLPACREILARRR